jgi:ABC-type Na+ efflux pump permease subunit
MRTGQQKMIFWVSMALLLSMFVLYLWPTAAMFMLLSGIVPLLIVGLSYRVLRGDGTELPDDTADPYELP